MADTLTLDQVTTRLTRLEREVAELRDQTAPNSQTPANGIRWVDKEELRRAFDALRSELNLTGSALGAKTLQRLMAEAGVGPTELSQAIIGAREE